MEVLMETVMEMATETEGERSPKQQSQKKAQQRFFGMVRADSEGEMENPSPEVAKVAATMAVPT